jgi:hypothetical protein
MSEGKGKGVPIGMIGVTAIMLEYRGKKGGREMAGYAVSVPSESPPKEWGWSSILGRIWEVIAFRQR